MEVNLNTSQTSAQIPTTPAVPSNTQANASAAAQQTTETPAVTYEKSTETNTAENKSTYTVDKAKIQQMVDESNRQKEAFLRMIQKTLFQQSNASNIADTGISFSKDFMSKIAEAADPETIAWAKEAVSEDGYHGVKQTAERIVGFAKALTGGDPSKVGEMRDAILKGFEAAEKAWGGELPEISQKTFDAVKSALDEWENEGKTETPIS